MRGMLPLHASSVVLHDKAWLFAGASGAGKSTLTAKLLKAGARLLADDLTPLTLAPTPVAWRGRPALRATRTALPAWLPTVRPSRPMADAASCSCAPCHAPPTTAGRWGGNSFARRCAQR